MNIKNIILNKLLDKYEISKSLTEKSSRRIILKTKNLNEYNIENYETKKLFHDTVFDLEKKNLIKYAWKRYEKRQYFRRTLAKY